MFIYLQGTGGQETGDIIKFYNEVFVPSTKSFLLNAGLNTSPAVPNHPRIAEERDQGDGEILIICFEMVLHLTMKNLLLSKELKSVFNLCVRSG